jgi:Sporulation and spore germination
MRARWLGFAAGLTLVALLLGWLLFVGLPRWYGRPVLSSAQPAAAPAEPSRKIKARLFYVSDDGTRLTAVERDVAYAEQTSDQAREIIAAQVAPVAEPLVSAIPPATRLRAAFVTDRGEAFVDLSGEVASAHSGGSMDELLTIYTIVHALTVNLPAVSTVQILVDGKEVETLAGHVDLRRPLARNMDWLEETDPTTTEPGPTASPSPGPQTQERGTADAIR